MKPNNSQAPILIIGGTGKTGRRISQRLQDQDIAVRIGSRGADPAFDWADQSTWHAALTGCRAAYISYYPDLAVPGALEAIGTLAQTALDAGVTRLVLLSGRGEEEAIRAEQALMDSGADWTIVRAGWFAQNFSENFLLNGVLAGEIALPTNGTREPFVDVDDIADVAVAALMDDAHIGRLYEVTGPRAITFAEAVAEISAASGRPVVYREIGADDYAAELKAAGLPEDYLSLVMYLFTTILDGRNEAPTDGVLQALGRAPKDFAAYARQTAATGVWEVRG